MVSRTFFAGALAVLSARAVVAGPCRPVTSSTVDVALSSAATESASASPVSSSAEIQSAGTLSTETLSAETLSAETETLETSLIVPTTDVTTSTIIEEASTTTAEGFTTTELTTSDATSYQTTETTVTEAETTTAEATTTAALSVPTPFNLVYDLSSGDFFYSATLQSLPQSPNTVFLGDYPINNDQLAAFTYDSQTSQLSLDSQNLCVYRDDVTWAVLVKTCPTVPSPRYTPLLCEKPTMSDELKCKMPGSQCLNIPSAALAHCGPTGEEWSQFYVRDYTGGAYLLYFGIKGATRPQLSQLQLQSISLAVREPSSF
ncbi:hypothetical protein NW768_010873 [Fusarium equiseti]|uniref:Uncharacterized protein n=1 Tax=Fusarium equiseti TaxID=61235 RepID=A0ABQ8QZ20_FUSEQ|nr:hypothetical protein NW768_010873 [Fusarium equiseti]